MRPDFERRTNALEARHQADQGRDEAARLDRFMEKHTDAELRRYGAICERTQDGTLPLTVEEQAFLDEMERKYADNST